MKFKTPNITRYLPENIFSSEYGGPCTRLLRLCRRGSAFSDRRCSQSQQHPFRPFVRDYTRVSWFWYQKGKTNLHLLEQEIVQYNTIQYSFIAA